MTAYQVELLRMFVADMTIMIENGHFPENGLPIRTWTNIHEATAIKAALQHIEQLEEKLENAEIERHIRVKMDT